MMKVLSLAVVAVLAAVGGCTPSYKHFPQLEVLDPLLGTQLTFQPPVVQRLAGDLIKIDVAVTNTSGLEVKFNYRYMFTVQGQVIDVSEFQLQPIVLPAGASAVLTGSSDKAVPPAPQGDFRMEIKRQ